MDERNLPLTRLRAESKPTPSKRSCAERGAEGDKLGGPNGTRTRVSALRVPFRGFGSVLADFGQAW